MEVLDLKDVESKSVALTRREKILRWAAIIRDQRVPLALLHQLEHWNATLLARPTEHVCVGLTAFNLAADDAVFKAAGLKDSSVGAAIKFFDLSRDDLHSFSCNCGGSISNTQMADRLNKMAGPAAPRVDSHGRLGRIVNGITRFW